MLRRDVAGVAPWPERSHQGNDENDPIGAIGALPSPPPGPCPGPANGRGFLETITDWRSGTASVLMGSRGQSPSASGSARNAAHGMASWESGHDAMPALPGHRTDPGAQAAQGPGADSLFGLKLARFRRRLPLPGPGVRWRRYDVHSGPHRHIAESACPAR